MTETELYKELSRLMKHKDEWKERIPSVAALLNCDSAKIQAKALWLLGEMGLAFPDSIRDCVPAIASFLNHENPKLRERAIHALGRIGRGSYHLIEPYWKDLFRFAEDETAAVRLSFLWASENIAKTAPDPYENCMHVFARLLSDPNDRVRMEAPEIFRVIGKQRPAFVTPFLSQLQILSETDENRVVRIHSAGAVKAALR